MAQRITGEWYEGLVKQELKSGNGRGDLGLDCGFSTTSRVDNVTFPGMSIPTCLQACTEYDYLPLRGEMVD